MRRWALVACVVVVACGVRGRPLPPELVQPEPPTDLVAKSVRDGVELSWRRPMRYSGGGNMRDLGGFDVERATGADSYDFLRVGRVELTDQTRFRKERMMTWTDTSVAAGDAYRYRVVAWTTDGYHSPPSGSVPIAYAPPPSATPPAPRAAPHAAH